MPRRTTRASLRLLLIPVLLAGVLLPQPAAQEPAPGVGTAPDAVRVELATGEVLIGTLISHEGNEIVLLHPRFGRLVIPKVDLLHPDQVPPPAGGARVIEVPLPAPTPPPPSWKGLAELGLTGATGNTSQSTFMAGLRAEHKTDELVKNIDFSFRRTEQSDAVTEEKSRLEGRLTWPELDSAWRTFLQGSIERDKFAQYDHRLAVAGGRGYAWEDTEETFLEGRFGLGVSKELGSPDDGIVPEGVLGLDYRHNYSKVESVTSTVELYPSLKDFGDYRALVRAAWEHKLAETSPWVFRVGGEDRFDKTPGTAKHNDLTYFISLGYTF